jgi:hypothetical protein
LTGQWVQVLVAGRMTGMQLPSMDETVPCMPLLIMGLTEFLAYEALISQLNSGFVDSVALSQPVRRLHIRNMEEILDIVCVF